MGNPKQKWTSDEEEALRAGVAKHGPGKWKLIQKDPEFNQFLHSRSNIDLKDKWRNMSAAVQGGSREKLRIPKPKDPIALAIIPPPQTQTQPPSQTMLLTQSQPQPQSHAVSVVPVPISIHDSTADHVTVKDDAVKDLPDGKIAPRYNEMIFEALSDLKQQSGLDIVSIVAYIEQRIEVPHNFRKQLGARLRRLVQQDKLEKVDSLYRLKNNTMETHTSNRKDNWPRQNLTTFYSKVGESLEEAAKTAAFKVVEAETKSYMAAEAVKEAEKFSKLAEETDSIFQFAKEIFDRCARGELVVVA